MTTSTEPSPMPDATHAETRVAVGGPLCGDEFSITENHARYKVSAIGFFREAWAGRSGSLTWMDRREAPPAMPPRKHVYIRAKFRGKPVLLHVGIEGA